MPRVESLGTRAKAQLGVAIVRGVGVRIWARDNVVAGRT